MIDGNYLASHQVKNCSHKDVSLFKGTVYFPEDECYKSAVAAARKPGQQVCPPSYVAGTTHRRYGLERARLCIPQSIPKHRQAEDCRHGCQRRLRPSM
jgi:hypothetical protein